MIYIYKKIIYMNVINLRVIICIGLLCIKIFFFKINSSLYIFIFLRVKFIELYFKRNFVNVIVEIVGFLFNC